LRSSGRRSPLRQGPWRPRAPARARLGGRVAAAICAVLMSQAQVQRRLWCRVAVLRGARAQRSWRRPRRPRRRWRRRRSTWRPRARATPAGRAGRCRWRRACWRPPCRRPRRTSGCGCPAWRPGAPRASRLHCSPTRGRPRWPDGPRARACCRLRACAPRAPVPWPAGPLQSAAPAAPARGCGLVRATAPRGGCVRAQAIALTERHSLAAAAELCAAARARSPHAAVLGDRALAIAVARGTPAVALLPLTLRLLRVCGPALPVLSAPAVPRASVEAAQPAASFAPEAASRHTCMFNVLALAVYMGRARAGNSARLGRPTCPGVSAYTCYMLRTMPAQIGSPPELPCARLVQRSERVAGGPGERAAVAAALEAQGTEA